MLSCAQLLCAGIAVLVELRLENYAVIDNVAVEFAPGLNLLTGETGAGKSILIDALALLMGDKASPDLVRFGAERAVISAVFEVESGSEKLVSRILENNGIDSDDANLILRREIAAKGRVFVNNQPATVAVLKQLAPHLAVIHAQSESLVSFDGAVRLALLDSYAGTQLEPVAEAFEKWNQVKGRIEELEHREQDHLRLVDLWTFQTGEIEDAKIQPGEDDQLEIKKRVLANAEKIYSAAMHAFDLLYEGAGSTSASLRSAQKHLEDLIRYEPKFQEALASLETARISVEDVGASLRDYAGGIEPSPERLAQIEDRLALLDRLKRKYGPTLADVVNMGVEVTRKLSEIENKDEILRQLRAELATAAEQYLCASRVISKKRYESAKKLEKLVEVEISRVMLALKASVETGSRKKAIGAQRTLVFDEIDTGIGGRAAEAVGKKLKSLARANQVLCVTHLPQIATFADHHYLIEKKKAGDRTRTTVREITGDEPTEEIARMLSGAKVSETSLKHAEQMLKANA